MTFWSISVDGVSVLGLNLKGCMAGINPANAADYLGTISDVEVVDENGWVT